MKKQIFFSLLVVTALNATNDKCFVMKAGLIDPVENLDFNATHVALQKTKWGETYNEAVAIIQANIRAMKKVSGLNQDELLKIKTTMEEIGIHELEKIFYFFDAPITELPRESETKSEKVLIILNFLRGSKKKNLPYLRYLLKSLAIQVLLKSYKNQNTHFYREPNHSDVICYPCHTYILRPKI